MRKFGTNYITGKPVKRVGFLPDDLYTSMLDLLMIVCVDIVVMLPDGRILIGKRSREPAKRWWIIGGRMWRGESFEEAAARNILRELGISITNLNRFKMLVTNSYQWDTRAQKGKGGCHVVAITMVLKITQKEAGRIKPNDEYASTKWTDPLVIYNDKRLHQALRDIALKAMFFPY